MNVMTRRVRSDTCIVSMVVVARGVQQMRYAYVARQFCVEFSQNSSCRALRRKEVLLLYDKTHALLKTLRGVTPWRFVVQRSLHLSKILPLLLVPPWLLVVVCRGFHHNITRFNNIMMLESFGGLHLVYSILRRLNTPGTVIRGLMLHFLH